MYWLIRKWRNMKKIVCDECEKDKPIYFNKKGIELCEECFYESKHYKQSELEEYWGVKLGKKLSHYDAFLVFDYESFEYYQEASEKYAETIHEALRKLGIDNIEVMADHDEDHAIIGFRKT